MRLLLDECCAHKALVSELKARNYDVARSIDLVGEGATDPMVFACGISENRILITANCGDFIALAEANDEHPGLMLIYPDDGGNAMPTAAIVKAVVNVRQSFGEDFAALRGQRIPLPQYVW